MLAKLKNILRLLKKAVLFLVSLVTPKRTLLIDDMRDIKADVVCRTYEAGIAALLKHRRFDILYLDHDLGDTETPERTGYDIICFLEENPKYLPREIVLVTSNPVGRQKMMVVLNKLYEREMKNG